MSDMTRKVDKFSFRLRPGLFSALDALRRDEKDIPTRGEMLNRLIERAAPKTAFKKIEGGLKETLAIARGEAKPARVSQASSADEKALRAVRRGVTSHLEKRAGNNCPDCGANLNLVGKSHNCGSKK